MRLTHIAAGLCIAAGAVQTQAATISVEITNATHSIHFTPILAVAHTEANHLFRLGEEASDGLQMMAEGGSLDGLLTLADSIGADTVANPAEGLLAPGAMTTIASWDTGDADRLSIVAMLLPTNDGFVGLDSWQIPSEPGTYTLTLNGYDAGTEANDELIVDGSGAPGTPGIPANPSGNSGTMGTGVTSEESNTTVHIHRGNVGDTMVEGGASDLDSRIHRWLNPVAKVTITVH